jgi:ubiquinone/menaquinone biosynthesis C-methylase UbiE
MTWFARLYLWATHRLYDEFAWAYDLASWLVSLGRWSGWRRRALDHVVGQRVLEVGFGTGGLLLELREAAGRRDPPCARPHPDDALC